MGNQFRNQLSPSGPMTNRQFFTVSRAYAALAAITALVGGVANDVLALAAIDANDDQYLAVDAHAAIADTSGLANSVTALLQVDDGNGGAFTTVATRVIELGSSTSKQALSVAADKDLTGGATVLEIDTVKGVAGQVLDLRADLSMFDTSAAANSTLVQLTRDDGAGGADVVIAERTVTIPASGHLSCAIETDVALPASGTYKVKLIATPTGGASTGPTNHDGGNLVATIQPAAVSSISLAGMASVKTLGAAGVSPLSFTAKLVLTAEGNANVAAGGVDLSVEVQQHSNATTP